MNIKIIAASVLCAASFHVQAQETTGFGVYHCTDLLLDNGKRTVAQNWALGYLSGMNLVWTRYAPEGVAKNPLGKVRTPADVFRWLDNYCRQHAQATLTPVLQTYFVELSGLKQK
jgi:ABC-type thiamine transport system substrate-binding protein